MFVAGGKMKLCLSPEGFTSPKIFVLTIFLDFAFSHPVSNLQGSTNTFHYPGIYELLQVLLIFFIDISFAKGAVLITVLYCGLLVFEVRQNSVRFLNSINIFGWV